MAIRPSQYRSSVSIACLRGLCDALEEARPGDFAAITLRAEALSHEAGVLAAG